MDTQIHMLAGDGLQFLGQSLRLLRIQRYCSGGIDGQNIMIPAIQLPIKVAAIVKMTHIALFGQDLHKIQQIRLDLIPETIIQDLASLFFVEIGGAKQFDKIRFFHAETVIQRAQFLPNGFV